MYMSNEARRLQLANELYNLEFSYNVNVRAIQIAKECGVSSSKLKKLQQESSKLLKTITNKQKELEKAMVLSQNIQHTSKEGWAYVKCLGDNLDAELIKVCINKECVHILMRDMRVDSPLTHSELAVYLENLTNKHMVKQYQQSVEVSARSLLNELGFIEVKPLIMLREPKDPVEWEPPPALKEEYKSGRVVVKLHAGKRWAQRVLNILEDSLAEDYYKANCVAINKDIESAVDNADDLWRDKDGILYKITEDNIIFVIGTDNEGLDIITLYEADFGFTKGINRVVAFEQAKVLEELSNSIVKAEEEFTDQSAQLTNMQSDIVAQIDSLRAQIDLLVATKRNVDSKLDVLSAEVTVKKQEFNKEHSKLFKKWKWEGYK